MTKERESITPSMERGSIDAGHHGDKVIGFDPATAPMETDAEAGGTPTQPAVSNPHGTSAEPRHNGTAYGTAMKPLQGKERTPRRNYFGIVLVIGVACLIGVIFGLF